MSKLSVFVINRKQDVGCREAISRQLRELGLAFELVEAVDGRGLSEGKKRRLADYPKMRRVLRVLSDGEIGCAASHQLVYRKMLEERIETACVLEDDARVLAFDYGIGLRV